jgi:hypothetical protein
MNIICYVILLKNFSAYIVNNTKTTCSMLKPFVWIVARFLKNLEVGNSIKIYTVCRARATGVGARRRSQPRRGAAADPKWQAATAETAPRNVEETHHVAAWRARPQPERERGSATCRLDTGRALEPDRRTDSGSLIALALAPWQLGTDTSALGLGPV